MAGGRLYAGNWRRRRRPAVMLAKQSLQVENQPVNNLNLLFITSDQQRWDSLPCCMARVPLIVRGPSVPRGQCCTSLVSHLDLLPLFYRTCGVEPPSTLEGRDISPLLNDPSGAIRDVVYSEIMGRMMVRDSRFKYVHYADGDRELYDLTNDPTEERNLADEPSVAAEQMRLQGLLLEHSLRQHPFRAMPVEMPPEPPRAKIEAEFLRRRK